MKLVVDLEANGLYNEVTKVHCIVAKDIDSGQVHKYYDYKGNDKINSIKQGIKHLLEAEQLIGHNFVDYDIRVLEKLYKVKFDVNKVVDTMLLSYMLDPHRKRHPQCPPSQLVGDKRKPIGAHSLANWGYVVGRGKVEHEDWTTFTKEMLHRCTEDVEITHLVAKKLGVV